MLDLKTPDLRLGRRIVRLLDGTATIERRFTLFDGDEIRDSGARRLDILDAGLGQV